MPRKRTKRSDRSSKKPKKVAKKTKPVEDDDLSDFVVDSSSQSAAPAEEPESLGLLEDCEAVFGTKDLYEVIGLKKGASSAEIRKGYHKTALAHHPDKVDKSIQVAANRKFGIIHRVYNVLKDDEQRKIYDENGFINEDLEALCSDYRSMFDVSFTVKDIEDLEKRYKGSDEEKQDLIRLYEKYKGNWDKISEELLLYRIEDDERYKKIAKENIESYVEERPAKATARRRRYEAEKAQVKDSDLDEHLAKIKRHQQDFGNLIQDLEDKYVKGKGKKMPDKAIEEPLDEDELEKKRRRPRKWIPEGPHAKFRQRKLMKKI